VGVDKVLTMFLLVLAVMVVGVMVDLEETQEWQIQVVVQAQAVEEAINLDSRVAQEL